MAQDTIESDNKLYTRRVFIFLGLTISTLIVIGIIYFAADLILLAFAAVLFAITLRSLGNWLSTILKVSPNIGTAIGIAFILIIFVLAVVIGLPILIQQSKKLIETLPESFEQAQHIFPWVNYENFSDLRNIIPLRAFISKSANFFASFLSVLASVVLMLVIGIYIAIDPKPYWRGIVFLVPKNRQKRIEEVLNCVGEMLHWWLIGILLTMAVVSTLTIIGLLILQIPLAILLGIIAGLLNFIPTFGPVLAAIPSIMIGLTQGPQKAFFVIILYMIVQALETNILTPIIMNRTVRLPPAYILIGQIMFAIFFGFLGLALAIPLLASITVMLQMLYVEDVLGHKT
jgi:predicted PurR-regulated permease PerM